MLSAGKHKCLPDDGDLQQLDKLYDCVSDYTIQQNFANEKNF